MALGADRYASRADALVFIACVVLSVAAMGLPDSWRQPIARGLRASVLAPFLYLQQQSEELRTSRARYDQVVAQRDSTALAAGFVPELRSENARLRGLLGLGQRLSGGVVPSAVPLLAAGPAWHRLPPAHSRRHADRDLRPGRRAAARHSHWDGDRSRG